MAPFDPATDLPDLQGKVALITGATSGIGFAVVQKLLRKGATVYLAARSESKAIAAIERLQAEGLSPGNGKPIWHKLVLNDPKEAKKSAEEFLARESRLDILVNNAGLFMKRFEIGPLGVSDIVVVNHLSPFVFTNTLLPLMKRTALLPDADVRIVNVASSAHSSVSKVQFKAKEDFNGPTKSDNPTAKNQRYGFTKLMNILWTRELARRLAESREDGGANIMCLSLHPGAIATEGNLENARNLPWPLSSIAPVIMRTFFRTPQQGAETALIAAARPEIRREPVKYQGGYLVPVGKIEDMSKMARDTVLGKDLWELSERVLSEET